jgi:hypothetical protein
LTNLLTFATVLFLILWHLALFSDHPVVLALAIGFFRPIVARTIHSLAQDPAQLKSDLERTPPIILLRATRDEASLVLGFTQSARFLVGKLFELVEGPQPPFRFWPMFKTVCVGTVLVAPFAFPLLKLLSATMPFPFGLNEVTLFAAGTLIPALAGGAFLTCSALVAFSVGYFNVTAWPKTIVEVDSAPIRTGCVITIFDEPVGSDSLRHAIYEHPSVQQAIGKIIAMAYEGPSPSNYQLTSNALTRKSLDEEQRERELYRVNQRKAWWHRLWENWRDGR